MNKSKIAKKIAFFVEGQTEQVFINKLVKEILGANISIVTKRAIGGATIPKQQFVRSVSLSKDSMFQVLIYDCGSDNRVKSEILDNIANLKESGYGFIIGLRDLYPLPIEDFSRLEKGLKFLPKDYWSYRKNYDIIIAVQEVETWFLAETCHFSKVDKRLTGSFINKHLNFNPFAINAMQRIHPSKDLNDIYQLVGKSYTKRYGQVQKLVNQLDYNYLSNYVSRDIPALGSLIDIIEQFKNNRSPSVHSKKK